MTDRLTSKLRENFIVKHLDPLFGEIPCVRNRGNGLAILYTLPQPAICTHREVKGYPSFMDIKVKVRNVKGIENTYERARNKLMKRENAIYQWFNKYNGTGHLFIKEERVEPCERKMFLFTNTIAVAKVLK